MATSSELDPGSEDAPVASAFSRDLMVLTKARLSILVVLTAMFGYLVATKTGSPFSVATFFHLFLGTILSAFGAAVFNQLMEVDADAQMRRTSDRPLPANRLPKPLAFILGWLLCAFGLIHLGMKVNIMAASMAAATLLTYLFVYTPLKRVSSSNTIVGAISGAFPPLIGWAGGDGPLWGGGALFLFGLLFFWQLPHFAAINWMYREEYKRGGFVMWSNDDETGQKTGRIAVVTAIFTFLFIVGFPLLWAGMAWWGAIPYALLGGILIALSIRFVRSGDRNHARALFFFTLLFLPAMMIVSYFVWR